MDIEKSKPNILLIMADQLVPFLTGAYGHKVVKTPNLDMLVEKGIRFDAAYTPCPICSPARSALMTGKYASNIKVYDNASPFGCDEPTFAHYLVNEGYDVVLSGKMHFIGPDQLHGFSRRLTTDIFPSNFEWTTRREETKEFGEMHSAPIAIDYVTAGKRQWSMQFEYDEEVHFRALQYLYSRRMQVGGTMQKPPVERDPKPFFLCVSYTHPHEPFHVTKELWDLYEGEEIDIPVFPQNLEESYSTMDKWLNTFHGVDRVELKKPENLYNMRRAYYGLVTYIDRKVGELIKTLDDTGLRENTIIIFTSDHGDMLGEKGMVQKRCFYEYSSRVPLIISFPDGWKKGTKIEQCTSLIDLAPTILDMAQVDDKKRLDMDGKSLMGLIEGNVNENRVIFSELHTEGVFSTCFMVREGKYKLIYVHGGDTQLFDLENDPCELNNLSGQTDFKQIHDRLKSLILEKFDIDAIEKNVRNSLLKRRLIKESMKKSNTHWDYFPYFDATKQYWREG